MPARGYMLTRSQTYDLSLCTFLTYCRQISGHWDEGTWCGAIRLGNGKPWATHFYISGPGVRSGQESSDNGSEVALCAQLLPHPLCQMLKVHSQLPPHMRAQSPGQSLWQWEIANATHANVKWTIIAEKQDI